MLPSFSTPGKQMSQHRKQRLMRLFQHYRSLYWRGKLPNYRVIATALEPGCMGRCDRRKRVIEIDVVAHRGNSRELRATMLHEMAHAGAAKGSRGHDMKFFAQLEMLLRKKAPVNISIADAGRVTSYSDLVPERFPLLKTKMDRLEKRRRNSLERFVRAQKINVRNISDDDIISDFRSAATQMTWKEAVLYVGIENHMVDESGRPLNRWARQLLSPARQEFTLARRNYLEMKQAEETLRAVRAARNEYEKAC